MGKAGAIDGARYLESGGQGLPTTYTCYYLGSLRHSWGLSLLVNERGIISVLQGRQRM